MLAIVIVLTTRSAALKQTFLWIPWGGAAACPRRFLLKYGQSTP